MDATKDDAYAAALTFNNSAWNYDADHDVYWQIGVQYCATPAATDFETLGIYVPGVYLTATANGDGTFSARINEQGSLNGFTARTAPMVFPVNTPGYSAQKAPTAYSYDGVSSYMEAGLIYVAAGMRGKDNGYDASGKLAYSGGAPWGVTDFKAAVRFIRYNQAILPGNTQSIFAFGMSGGGAQTAVIGASGDSQLYYPYLEAIGAAMYDATGQTISDAITGAMAWCPITSLDLANEAYEWNLGQYSNSGTRADGTFTAALSKNLASAYVEYINQLGLKDENGNVLTLEPSQSGIFAAGSYYDYLVKTVETSLNHFLADTTFPYTETTGGFMRPDGNLPSGGKPQGGTPPAGEKPQGTPPSGGLPAGTASSTTYQTVQEYMAALNKDGEWVTYDDTTKTARVTSLAGFVNSQKTPSKNVAAFDSLDRSSPENGVFGNDENDALHFDALLANLLTSHQAEYAKFTDWNASYVEAYTTDLQAVDVLGNNLQYRINMYNPMYYLLPYYTGYQTAAVAKYWRINTGIKQGDTATTVEMNLALALENYEGINAVDFTTVWGQGHVQAERTGDSTTNFINWVIQITKK
ncbi:MAG TPA: subtype A tannase [Anaerolineaceae bacterium]|nr:subtype A tannase [Anaerolineaceae bacterium]HPN53521.1 subtype A tannase [Anaerolineaceae bacterium]